MCFRLLVKTTEIGTAIHFPSSRRPFSLELTQINRSNFPDADKEPHRVAHSTVFLFSYRQGHPFATAPPRSSAVYSRSLPGVSQSRRCSGRRPWLTVVKIRLAERATHLRWPRQDRGHDTVAGTRTAGSGCKVPPGRGESSARYRWRTSLSRRTWHPSRWAPLFTSARNTRGSGVLPTTLLRTD